MSAVCAMLPYMVIREATAEDWPAIWPILREAGTAGEGLTWDSARGPGTLRVDARAAGPHLLATVPEAFRHPPHRYVGLHIMYKPL